MCGEKTRLPNECIQMWKERCKGRSGASNQQTAFLQSIRIVDPNRQTLVKLPSVAARFLGMSLLKAKIGRNRCLNVAPEKKNGLNFYITPLFL